MNGSPLYISVLVAALVFFILSSLALLGADTRIF